MIVPDASVVVQHLADPDVDERAVRATEILEADTHWLVPEHWRLEVVNALRGLMFAGQLTDGDAYRILDWLRLATVIAVPTGPLVSRIWELRSNLTAYDAAYVAVAEANDVTLVTADARIARAGVARCAIRLVI